MVTSFILSGLRNNVRGFGFLVKWFFKDGKIATKNRYDTLFYLDPFQKIDGTIIREGYFDQDVYEALASTLKKGDVFWDIGANIGLHAITLKKNMPDITCLAFEPFPVNFQALVKNIKANQVEVKCYNFALHNKLCLNKLYTSPQNAGQTGFTKINNSFDTEIEVPAFTGDFIIKEFSLEIPNVIKIDTEGNELNIFKGMKNMLSCQQLRTIVFECNQDYESIEELLHLHNFKIERLSEAPNFKAERII